jgi:hypothetical protein
VSGPGSKTGRLGRPIKPQIFCVTIRHCSPGLRTPVSLAPPLREPPMDISYVTWTSLGPLHGVLLLTPAPLPSPSSIRGGRTSLLRRSGSGLSRTEKVYVQQRAGPSWTFQPRCSSACVSWREPPCSHVEVVRPEDLDYVQPGGGLLTSDFGKQISGSRWLNFYVGMHWPLRSAPVGWRRDSFSAPDCNR